MVFGRRFRSAARHKEIAISKDMINDQAVIITGKFKFT
jgi:hypothetical protein